MKGVGEIDRSDAVVRYVAALTVVVAGAAVAVHNFPGGFDWPYTVVSKLASPRHNPDGGAWLCGALLAAMLMLWPVAAHLGGSAGNRARPRAAVAALRTGLAGGALLALEGLLALDFSGILRKGHEALALVTLVGFYAGVLGLYAYRIRREAAFLWPALLVVLPLVAIGVSQLTLYLGQRELGWVDAGWRQLGVPLWLSFAFWQWLAVALLGTALGHLVMADDGRTADTRTAAHRHG